MPRISVSTQQPIQPIVDQLKELNENVDGLHKTVGEIGKILQSILEKLEKKK